MKVVVLSRKRALYTTRRLKEEGEKLGHRVDVVDPLKCVLLVKRGETALLVGGKPLARPDVVIPRIGTAGADYSISVVRQFALMKVPLLNGPVPIARAKNKLECLQLLASKGIRIPPTLMSRYPRRLDKLMTLVDGPPLIMKLLRGTQGTGVVFAESRASIESMLETIWSLGEDIMLQKFVSESKGRDIRALVIGGKVRAAMRRTGPEGEFRSNIHRGGTGEKVRIPPDYAKLAVAAARAVGLDVAGVDLLESADGPMVVEVNASPGFEGLEAAVKENVARMFIEAAVRIARRKA